jgi:hypothetical protein
MKIQQNYSDYYLNNPSNHVAGVANCFQVPGVTCRAMNVKLNETIDTETALLRGVSSEPVRNHEEPVVTHVQPPVMPEAMTPVAGSTRMSKSCYFEQSLERTQGALLPSDFDTARAVVPEWSTPERLFGTSSRIHAKYSN